MEVNYENTVGNIKQVYSLASCSVNLSFELKAC